VKREAEEAFWPITAEFEGDIPYMYLDNLGLVTTARGNLIDHGSPPWQAALSCPWINEHGEPATAEEIIACWKAVKADPYAAAQGHYRAKKVKGNTLRLTVEGAHQVVAKQLAVHEAILTSLYPSFPRWPWQAQLATHLMAWACGTHFHKVGFTALRRLLLADDFRAAAGACHINTDGRDRIPNTADDNRGVIPRNAAMKKLYLEAVGQGLDPAGPLDTVEGRAAAIEALGFADVPSFQRAHGLVDDGIIGPLTMAALRKAFAAPADELTAEAQANGEYGEPAVIEGGTVHAMPESPPRVLDLDGPAP